MTRRLGSFVSVAFASMLGCGAACAATDAGERSAVIASSGSSEMSRAAGMTALVYAHQDEASMAFRNDVPIPDVGPSQVLLQVKAAAINPVDYKKPTIPLVSKLLAPDGSVVGIDVSGIVVKKGAMVSDFEVGDRVYGFSKGSIAQFAICDANKLAKKPEKLTHVQAAALPTAAVTAYQALRDNGLQAGDRLLVIGASGGCGLAGVAVGKALGAVVTGVCSTRNIAIVRAAGADEIVDYTQGDAAFSSLRDFDLVLDTVTGSGSPGDRDYELLCRSALKSGRPYAALNSGASDWLRVLAAKTTGWRRLLQRSAYDLVLTDQNGRDLDFVGQLAANGKLEIPLSDIVPFKEGSVREAFSKLYGRRTVGKIVVEIAK